MLIEGTSKILGTYPIICRVDDTSCALSSRNTVSHTHVIVTYTPQLSTHFLGENDTVKHVAPYSIFVYMLTALTAILCNYLLFLEVTFLLALLNSRTFAGECSMLLLPIKIYLI